MSKRFFLAKAMQTVGLTRLLEGLRAKPGILIINHHRIGDASATRFDRAVFSATAEELDEQVRMIQQRFHVVGGEELEALATGEAPLDRFHVAITFDDGYLDNYAAAFPVLRDRGCPGFFFLVPEYVGSAAVPWWDAIAYLVRNTAKAKLRLRVPTDMEVTLGEDREGAVFAVLQHYKRPDNRQGREFVAQLAEEAEVALPSAGRRFLNWDEAAEMQRAGMTIGSHTLTHPILSQLPVVEQERELRESRSILEERLGRGITALAYPVGTKTAFTAETERAAEGSGYRISMSFYGGVNRAGTLRPMNLLRTSVEPGALLFRNQVALFSHFGKLPYS